jgi:signal transduction histidine kinase/DNA-binding response OmpR family regulator
MRAPGRATCHDRLAVRPRPTIVVATSPTEPHLRALAERVLAGDATMVCADAVETALAAIEAHHPVALVTSRVLADGSGLELAERSRQIANDLPVVLVTPPAEPAGLLAAMNAGRIYRFVETPVVGPELRAAVRAAIDGAALRHERDGLVERLQRRLESLSTLYDVTAAGADATSMAHVAELTLAALQRALRFDVAAVMITGAEPRASVLHLHCQRAMSELAVAATQTRVRELCTALIGIADTGPLSLVVSGERSPATEPGVQGTGRPPSAAHVPVVVDGQAIGVIYLAGAMPRAFSLEDEKLLYLLATQTADAARRVGARRSGERKKLALMVEAMADGVVMTDDSGEIFLINPAARRMLGLAASAPVTRAYLKDRLGFYPFDLVVAAGGVVREELKIGDKVLHSIVSPVLEARERPVGTVVVLRDITERKELDRRKEEFVSVVSHELRTPLTSIAGALDIVLSSYAGGLGDKQRRYLELARSGCAKLNVFVDDLLDVARYERGKMPMAFAPLGLDELVRECVDRYRPATEAKRVTIAFRADPTRIVGDNDRLTQVLHNLLSNAIKFTPDGGRIEVEVFGPGVASTYAGVTVWNNGDTIPERDRERVFDKFEQVQASSTRRVGGTGLGLAISRAIIEAHGGRIWVEATPAGTKFVLTLPHAPEVASVEPGPGPRRPRRGTRIPALHEDSAAETAVTAGSRILIVDEDRYAAYIVKGALMASGHTVHVAHDTDEALAWAREHHPDLVLLEIQLSGAGGHAVLEIIKHDPDTRKAHVVLVGPPEREPEALAVGADAFLTKPLDMDTLHDEVARLLTEKTTGQRARVLVVDDDDAIRMISREVLSQRGFRVREAASGPEALVLAASFKPDLILLDVMMPELDGFETAKRLRGDLGLSLTPIIFVSARSQTSDKVHAFKLGADDYLVKPFDAVELVARCEKALDRRGRELDASPTTKLPGGASIEAEIERRIAGHRAQVFCYLDLDNLKSFNDHYGYAKADGVIRQTGDLVRQIVERLGGEGAFAGHIAGDDFVFIASAECADAVCAEIIANFDRLAPLYYNRTDRERGYIEGPDRYGQTRRFPVLSVSIAGLTYRPGERRFACYADVAASAAEAKQLAKTILGSCYVRDGQQIMPPLGAPDPDHRAAPPG